MEYSPFVADLLDRFLRYVRVDTMSNPHITDRRPTTAGQMDLINMVEKELREFGLHDVYLDPNGYIIARLPSNLSEGKQCPTIGFMAHVDTADDVMGNHVKPRVIECYDGKDIQLNDEFVLSVSDNPELQRYVGQTIITTDGTTLLGADDKAGLAIIMAVARKLSQNPDIKHGEIELIITTDEETGSGMDFFPIDTCRSKCCYTLDGDRLGMVEAECFNAATVEIDFHGVPFHLGAARGKMVNSVTMATLFIASLPQAESPEATDGRYGYYCAHEIHGTAEKTHLIVYLRDFDIDRLQQRIDTLKQLAKTVEMVYLGGKVEINDKIVYRNMYNEIKKHPEVMEAIFVGAEKLQLELEEKVIRGGTDGARLAELGIPAPNLFTGGHNYHSRFEWAALSTMETAAQLVEQIIAYWKGVSI